MSDEQRCYRCGGEVASREVVPVLGKVAHWECLQPLSVPKLQPSEIKHRSRLSSECRTPGTRSYRRVMWALACMSGAREWYRPWRSIGPKGRTKLDTYRLMIRDFGNDGGVFTYIRAAEWLSGHARHLPTGWRNVSQFLSHHRTRLGIRPIHRFVEGPIVWEVVA